MSASGTQPPRRSRPSRARRLSASGIPGEPGEPRPVADALAEVGAQLGLPDPNVLAPLMARWAEVVGAELAPHTRVRGLRDGVLVVGASPAWASQLRYLSADLLERVREVVGAESVKEVRVSVDRPGAPRSSGGHLVD